MSSLDTLQSTLENVLAGRILRLERRLGEITITVAADAYLEVCRTLATHPELAFEQLIDLCGLDYSAYRDAPWEGPRYAAALHLLGHGRHCLARRPHPPCV